MRNWISQFLPRYLSFALLLAGFGTVTAVAQEAGKSIREVIAAATVAETPAVQRELILSLKLKPLPEAATWFDKWKGGEIFILAALVGIVLERGAVAASGKMGGLTEDIVKEFLTV